MLHVVFIEVVFIYYNSLIYKTTMFFLYVNYFDEYILFGFFVVAQKIEVKNAP